ncbi:hypothetical protein [Micavibrio aeruginosavorus]|uniref:Uncharacterized protein n=1 Tax=Micavibrio aeruginosavorus (strain ARL-13) TaxID=856793 RepID=G2KM21_MICAA|nr:hypothetical protein [Micavibrio aeruginosavorus]AEP09717.1 hypothetical protein MICA_1399 [Micavibrio aeruginosavorus ARL-13]
MSDKYIVTLHSHDSKHQDKMRDALLDMGREFNQAVLVLKRAPSHEGQQLTLICKENFVEQVENTDGVKSIVKTGPSYQM